MDQQLVVKRTMLLDQIKTLVSINDIICSFMMFSRMPFYFGVVVGFEQRMAAFMQTKKPENTGAKTGSSKATRL